MSFTQVMSFHDISCLCHECVQHRIRIYLCITIYNNVCLKSYAVAIECICGAGCHNDKEDPVNNFSWRNIKISNGNLATSGMNI